MASGILDTAVSGLTTLQRSLQTVSNNIANVNTEGYSRQRVELGTNPAERTGEGFIGKGVHIKDIVRSYDQFTTAQLRSSTSTYSEAEQFQIMASRVDDLLASEETSLSPALKKFFNAVNDVTNDPTSVPARQSLLSESGNLVQRFSTMSSRLDELQSQVNSNLVSDVEKINSYAKSIAKLNIDIARQSDQSGVAYKTNDLLDQRDLLVNKLSELVDVSVVPEGNSMVSVFVGQGQTLVLSGQTREVVTQQSRLDTNKLEIGVKDPVSGNFQDITRQLSGGRISGSLNFRDKILDEAKLSLGAIAASVTMEFNRVHKFGYDLDGNAGQDFFTGIANVPVTADPGNTGSITAVFDSAIINKIDNSDYRLNVGAGPSYTLTRLSDNSSISLTDSGGQLVATSPDSLPGIAITLGGTAPVAGDTFLIRPTYDAAKNIAVNLTDPRKIAAASSLNSTGSALVGDNRNALALAELESKAVMYDGTTSFKEGFVQLVSDVGNQTSSAKISASAQEVLLNNAKEQWSSVSGVNLDQEAAELIKLQQAYQASSQTIATTRRIFDTLMNSIA